MSKYKKNTFWKSVLAVIITLVVITAIFMTTTLVLASIHDQSIIAEWQSWFGLTENVSASINSLSHRLIV